MTCCKLVVLLWLCFRRAEFGPQRNFSRSASRRASVFRSGPGPAFLRRFCLNPWDENPLKTGVLKKKGAKKEDIWVSWLLQCTFIFALVYKKLSESFLPTLAILKLGHFNFNLNENTKIIHAFMLLGEQRACEQCSRPGIISTCSFCVCCVKLVLTCLLLWIIQNVLTWILRTWTWLIQKQSTCVGHTSSIFL